MPRLSAVPLTDTRVQTLAALHAEIEAAGRTALEKARQAGEVLRGVEWGDRERVAAEAGISPRTARDYVRIAEGWAAIRQRAAELSIRGALAVIGPSKVASVQATYSVKLDTVSPDDLTKALGSMRGQSARVTVRVRRRVEVVKDETQPSFFDDGEF